jgi:large subunit ribosomal protein L22
MAQARAIARNVKGSPRKVRLVTDAVRGRKAIEALTILQFMPQHAARDVYKVLKSAVANAENNYQLEPTDLWIHTIMADEGRTLKRAWRVSKGRAFPKLRRHTHITVIVEDRE